MHVIVSSDQCSKRQRIYHRLILPEPIRFSLVDVLRYPIRLFLACLASGLTKASYFIFNACWALWINSLKSTFLDVIPLGQKGD